MTETKPSFFTFKFDISTFIALCIAMYLAYSSHVANMQNTQKLNALLIKYEQTLDTVIASDKATLAQYQANMKKALAKLSPQERKLMMALLEIERNAE
ncbi:MAG: hypothetical protein WA981_04130 [Glaciecola sp.]